jgi:hypothetical protein
MGHVVSAFVEHGLDLNITDQAFLQKAEASCERKSVDVLVYGQIYGTSNAALATRDR